MDNTRHRRRPPLEGETKHTESQGGERDTPRRTTPQGAGTTPTVVHMHPQNMSRGEVQPTRGNASDIRVGHVVSCGISAAMGGATAGRGKVVRVGPVAGHAGGGGGGGGVAVAAVAWTLVGQRGGGGGCQRCLYVYGWCDNGGDGDGGGSNDNG